MSDAPKVSGKNFPTPAVISGRVCFIMEVPDALEYRAAVLGQVGWLADWRCWKHDESDYSDPPQVNRDIAEMFAEGLVTARFEECPMTCDDIADCIETDAGVQSALQDFVDHAYSQDIPGKKPSPEYLNENAAGDNAGCDNDVAWGRIRNGLIERSFQRSIDFLDKVNEITNNQDALSDALNSIPVLGEVLGVVGVASWIAFYDDIRDWFSSSFVAQDTTDLRDQIACDLFCLWQDDCSLSVQQIRDYYIGKLAPDFPGLAEALGGGIFQVATALGTLIEDYSSFAVYILQAAQYGFMAEINDWFSFTIQASKNDLLVGEASADWMVLCDECAPPAEQILLFDSPINFGGTQYDSIDFTPGVEMTFAAVNPTTGRYGVCLYAPAGDYTQVYDIDPAHPATPGSEIVWLYVDTSDATQLATGATSDAGYFPTPVDVRMLPGDNLKCTWWWSSVPFLLHVTLTPL